MKLALWQSSVDHWRYEQSRRLLAVPQAHRLEPLVAYNSVKVGEKQLAELGAQLTEMVGADPPASVAECVTFVKTRKDEWALPDADVVKVCG